MAMPGILLRLSSLLIGYTLDLAISWKISLNLMHDNNGACDQRSCACDPACARYLFRFYKLFEFEEIMDEVNVYWFLRARGEDRKI